MKSAFRGAAVAFALCAGALARAQTVLQAIPFESDALNSTPTSGQWVAAVLGCASLLALVIVGLHRYRTRLTSGTRPDKRLVVLERTMLAHQTQLVLVQYEGRRMLFAVSPAQTQCLRDDAVACDVETVGIK